MCFLSKEGSKAQLSNPRALPGPGRASPAPAPSWQQTGKGTFPTAASSAREMSLGSVDFTSKCLSSLKNFMSKLLCPTENSGQVFKNFKYFFSYQRAPLPPCTCPEHCNFFSFQRLKAWGVYFSYCPLSHRSHWLLKHRCCPVTISRGKAIFCP